MTVAPIEEGLPDVTKFLGCPPVMPRDQFADWIRVEPGIVLGWMNRGYIPTVMVGKHRLVNVVQYVRNLLDQENV